MILFVDDDEKVLKVYTELLTVMGYKVIACNSPERALKEVYEHQYEIEAVISDYCMPAMLGTELLQEVAKNMPTITKVLVTGYAPENIANDVVVLRKPFSIHTLVGILENPQQKGKGAYDVSLMACAD